MCDYFFALSLSHMFFVVLDLSIPDLCLILYFVIKLHKFKCFKSHYLIALDDLHYGLEIEKKDLSETLPIFNFCLEMSKNQK